MARQGLPGMSYCALNGDIPLDIRDTQPKLISKLYGSLSLKYIILQENQTATLTVPSQVD